MNKEQVTGKVDEVKVKVKEKLGHATHNPKLDERHSLVNAIPVRLSGMESSASNLLRD